MTSEEPPSRTTTTTTTAVGRPDAEEETTTTTVYLNRQQKEMTLKGGTTQACAACKYQRRKCNSDCPLAPYFPPDQPKMFQNAHRLFGVSNILKLLKQLEPHQKLSAMQSVIYQATVRDRYPVTGCLGLICQLQFLIRQTQDELRLVLSHLDFCRHHHHHHQQQQQPHPMQTLPPNDPSSSPAPLELACGGLSLHHNPPPPPPHEYDVVSVVGGGGGVLHPYDPATNAPLNFDFLDPKDNSLNSLWPNDIQNPLTIQSAHQEVAAAHPQSQTGQEVNDYDELHPFFDTFDDRQSYVESKEAYESSSESSPKDTAQSTDSVADNELKSAAACFSLISLG